MLTAGTSDGVYRVTGLTDAVAFDNALLMADIGHEWRPRDAEPARRDAPA